MTCCGGSPDDMLIGIRNKETGEEITIEIDELGLDYGFRTALERMDARAKQKLGLDLEED